MESLHVTLFGKQGAEKWVRHAYRIPDGVGCWTPYRVLLHSYGMTSHSAFYTFAEFKRWLKSTGRELRLSPHYKENTKPAWVARFGKC